MWSLNQSITLSQGAQVGFLINQSITLFLGAQGGLRLQLNIEQYEYMRGPNDGAGVKLLVHQPHDIPLVKDHGLAVPSGMHGFVALKIVEVSGKRL
jgi:hypothetical protein